MVAVFWSSWENVAFDSKSSEFSFSTRTCPHLLMRTEDSLPQDSFPGVNDSIFKLAAIPSVVLFLWFMWEDVAITSKSNLLDHLRHLLCRL